MFGFENISPSIVSNSKLKHHYSRGRLDLYELRISHSYNLDLPTFSFLTLHTGSFWLLEQYQVYSCVIELSMNLSFCTAILLSQE